MLLLFLTSPFLMSSGKINFDSWKAKRRAGLTCRSLKAGRISSRTSLSRKAGRRANLTSRRTTHHGRDSRNTIRTSNAEDDDIYQAYNAPPILPRRTETEASRRQVRSSRDQVTQSTVSVMPNLEAIGQRTRSFFQSIARRRATSDSECPTPTADSRPQMIRKSTTQDENVYQPVQVGTKVESPEHASGAKRKGVDKVIYQPLNAPPISVKPRGLKVGQEKSDSLRTRATIHGDRNFPIYTEIGDKPKIPGRLSQAISDLPQGTPLDTDEYLVPERKHSKPNRNSLDTHIYTYPDFMDVLALRSNKKSEGTINKRPSVIEEVRE